MEFPFSALMLLVGRQKGHLTWDKMAADIFGYHMAIAHLPVNATEGIAGLPRFAWKMAVKTVCAYVWLWLYVEASEGAVILGSVGR